jgi:hypothetical protein
LSIYAKDTVVSVEKSRAEIEATLARYGATAFAYATNMDKAMIKFEVSGRHIAFVLNMPDRNADRFKYPTFRGKIQKWGRELSPELARTKWDQECRQRWRCLALAIKAKLESVETGIATFEDEFMAHILLPNGQTVGQFMKPQIEAAYQSGVMPPLLPHFGGDK